MSYPFNVRVYFLLWDSERKRLLFSREKIGNTTYLKFPGGGLEYGEGTRECAAREAMEEIGIPITTLDLLGITENFVPSLFKKEEQVIAVYYIATCNDFDSFKTSLGSLTDNDFEGMIWYTPETFDALNLQLASDREMLNRFSDKL